MKLRARYTKMGKIRFTSHRDTARHWERAVRKADVSLAYSAGFTPRPRMAFGLALPTGAESLAEYLDLDLLDGAGDDLGEMAERFSAALPAGYVVTHVVERLTGGPSLQEDVVACGWTIDLAGVDLDSAQLAVAEVLGAGNLLVTRERKGRASTDDVRADIVELRAVAVDGRVTLDAVLAATGRTLRPAELVGALFGTLDPLDAAARVLRTHQWIERDGTRRELIPASPAPRALAGCA